MSKIKNFMKIIFYLLLTLIIQIPLNAELFKSKEEEKLLMDRIKASYAYAYMNCLVKQRGISKEYLDKGITTTFQLAELMLADNFQLDPNLLANNKVIETSEVIEKYIGDNCSNNIFVQSDEILTDLINSVR